MKTRGLKDLYLPESIAIHIKYILICTIFTPLWGLCIHEHGYIFLIGTFSMMFADLEIIRLITCRISKLEEKFVKKFEDTHSRKEVTLTYVLVFIIFLVIVLVICTLVFVSFLILLHLINGWGFANLIGMWNQIKIVIKVTSIALICTTPLFLFGKWQDAMKKGYELREQTLIFQNETLKNQVNPHFLFNSLNTLSSLINTQSEIASYFISKLSVIYRYILENSTKVQVPLKAELTFVRDYFYLYEIRSEKKISLNIDICEDDFNYEILPVSLQLLIENAIKHNMATLEKPLKIDVYIEGQYIHVRNNIQKMATQVVSTKIGLKNLNERVRLITGKEIRIEETMSDFLVIVPLLS